MEEAKKLIHFAWGLDHYYLMFSHSVWFFLGNGIYSHDDYDSIVGMYVYLVLCVYNFHLVGVNITFLLTFY